MFTLAQVEEALKRAQYLLEKEEINELAGNRGDNKIAYRDLTHVTLELLKHPESLTVPLESLSPLQRIKGKD